MRSPAVRRAALLLGAAALLLTPLRMTAQSPVNPVNPREKQVFVTVLDKSGMPVKSLSMHDIVVREDGQVREVTDVTLATDPLWVTVLVDTSKEPRAADAATQALREALAAFVSEIQSTSENSSMSLTECAGAAVTDVNFTTKADVLNTAIQHLTTGPQSRAVMLEALLDSSSRLRRVSSPRREIVSLDFDNSLEDSNVLPSKVFEAVHAAGASLWAVSIQRAAPIAASGVQDVDLTGSLAGPSSREAVLDELPNLTGGEHLRVLGTTSLESTLRKLADALTHQYLVTYIRPLDAKAVSSITASSPRGAKTLIAPWVR